MNCIYIKYILCFSALCMFTYMTAENKADKGPLEYVNPFIGNAENGHTFPGACLPFGLIQASPHSGNGSWKYCSGYNYDDEIIEGFAQTHLNGTGVPDLGDILMYPFCNETTDKLKSHYNRDTQTASPGYYSVELTDAGVNVELTATHRTAFHRYSFTKNTSKYIYIDLTGGLSNKPADSHRGRKVHLSKVEMPDSKTIIGFNKASAWVERRIYYVIQFDKPYKIVKKIGEPEKNTKKIILKFNTNQNDIVQVKVGLSTVSIEGAKLALEKENPGWNFESVKEQAQSKWEKLLSRVQVQGTPEQKTAFYTSLYHLYTQPNDITDVDGRYRGVNDSVFYSKSGYYSTLSLWDTYRAAHPLYTILTPEYVNDFVNSMIEHAKVQGYLPIWALWGKENYCMIANHAIPVVVDAYLKGFNGFDAEEAYTAIKNSLTVNHPKSNWDIYMKYGYYPFDVIKEESVSRTVESCYDDYCAAQLARNLGKEEDYTYFLKRSGFYKNLFDSRLGLLRGRDSKGNWRTPFNPFLLSHAGTSGGDFTEGNSWQYTWHVQHDIKGLIELMGGNEKFVQKLDSLFFLETRANNTGFTSDVTGLIGQYAHGNEPSHHVAYLYSYADRKDKTQFLIREIFDRFYLSKPDGLCGNDDCGQMSAWHIFSAMGFYPVDPISGEYVIGAPQLDKVVLTLPKGKTFTMEAKGLSTANKYVHSIELNGVPLTGLTIAHKDIMKGGHLIFVMTDKPDIKLKAPETEMYPDTRKRICFDFDWKFMLGDTQDACLQTYNDVYWPTVQLPHDWSIALDVEKKNGANMGFFPGGIGWYRKTFDVPSEYKGKKISILFDGVYHQSDVYINGKHLGFHPYGYIGFEYDLSPFLKYGEKNTIAVRVNHSDAPSSRWYSGSGIYRHVWLNVTAPIHISTWGTYITTPTIEEDNADVDVITSIENYTAKKGNILLESRIKDTVGQIIACSLTPVSVKEHTVQTVKQQLKIANPCLWSVDSPSLYTLESVIRIDDKIIDDYHTPFGVRHFNYNAQTGFHLNGKAMKMKGVNLHQDAGALGTAAFDKSYERRLKILKEIGCNAIRCSHNPPSPEFLDLCDKLGFLVIDEAFDKWKSGYYETYFDTWWQKDLGGMIRRDRNHPSIIMWSIGNELMEQEYTSKEGTERARMLQDYVHKQEPTRPVMLAVAPGNLKERVYNETGFTEVTDIVGYNYQEPFYLDDKTKFPERIMFGSEVFPFFRGRKDNIRGYIPLNPWYDTNKEFIFGQFIWAGIDYLGESSGWPSKGWPTAPFNTCMFEKPFAAFFRSVWSNKPIVSIAVVDQSLDIDPGKDHWGLPFMASHWNFPQYKKHIIQVQTITNCESVELWINKQSMGRRYTKDYPNNTIVWYVPYQEGKIEAHGFNDEVKVAEYALETSGKPAKIVLSTDEKDIKCNGQDLSHVTISLVDANGILVPDADMPITVIVEGEGNLLGVDNGDLRNHQSYAGSEMKTYQGKMLAIIRSTRFPGNIRVRVKSKYLKEETLTIKATKL